jgi:mono/diheme cytochrome c family protein
VDTANVVAVFADDRATVLASGAVVASDRSVHGWRYAAILPGEDGSPDWIGAVGRDGRIYRLHGMSQFEDVSPRYGLGAQRVLGGAVLGAGLVSFLLDHEIAVADGRLVVTRGAEGFRELVGGAGVGAGVGVDVVDLFGTSSQAVVSYRLPGIRSAAIDRAGRLYAITSRALYALSDRGSLELVHEAGGERLHGLAASGDNLWFADGAELGILDLNRGGVRVTRDASVGLDATLAPASNGDVWVLAGASLKRFARMGARTSAAAWTETLEPIFVRACSSCHLPDGDSGTDLSTPQAWESKRPAIRDRVVVRKTMPPAGHPFSEADREAIESWTEPQTLL